MNHPVIPIAVQGASRQRKREAPKGRRADPQSLREVQALLGDGPRRRDLLIEYLHRIQDAFGALVTLLAWAAVGIPLAIGMWITLQKAIVLFK